MSVAELTTMIEIIKARVSYLYSMCGDTTINQKKRYLAEIDELKTVQNSLVTLRMNTEE